MLKSAVAWFAEAPWLNRDRLRVYPKIFALAYLLSFGLWMMSLNGRVSSVGKPIGVDFECYWAASEMALTGQAPYIYNLDKMGAAEKKAVGGRSFVAPWNYPPTFLLIVLPAALATYLVALAIWTLLTFTGYTIVLRRIIPRSETLWPALAFPGAYANLQNGQNGLLTVSLLGAALLSLESSPILAGVFFGLMTYKPPLGLLVPLVLIATGRWRAFFAAMVTAVVFAGVSLAMFGAETWRAFFNSLAFTRHMVIENGGVKFYSMQTAFAAVRLVGGTIWVAYAVQTTVMAIVAVLVVWLWRQKVDYRLQAAGLVTGMVLASPYTIYYDLGVLALPIAWLALQGRDSEFLPFEKTLLAVAWLLPLICESIAHYAFVPLTPIVSALLLIFIVRLARISVADRAARLSSAVA